jgi:hypothetical protein
MANAPTTKARVSAAFSTVLHAHAALLGTDFNETALKDRSLGHGFSAGVLCYLYTCIIDTDVIKYLNSPLTIKSPINLRRY